MLKEKEAPGVAPGLLKGARSATGGDPGAVAEKEKCNKEHTNIQSESKVV